MAIKLLALSNGRISLEYDPHDQAAISAAIRELFGGPNVAPHIICAEIKFGGEAFTHLDEWDDPCLISSTANGDHILKTLHNKLIGNS
ncbi:hypothetical protein K3X13_14820 [Aliiroseovarius crassostreae]|uniref:hypothetical protein n=1 Tax=Aliiroseovarius crassostreae TaxID=154981 RepID=UPI0021FA5069|nr:hypothetical protein [Aliiroseovarius crassostreae]UWP92260.1 hypothetical protein K3X13_14820 [Aliiroseovarius crassostreae]